MSEQTAIPKIRISVFFKLITGLTLVMMYTVLGYFYIYSQMSHISNLTTRLYNHPLRVTRAVLSADTNIIKIHRGMKDVALSSTDKELAIAIAAVDRYEKEVYSYLAIVREWILGDAGKLLLTETTLLFQEWKPIRDEVIFETMAGRKSVAFTITKEKGAEHVEKLNLKMEELKDYAADKASGMLMASQSARRAILRSTLSLLLIFAIVLGVFGYFFTRDMTKNVKNIIRGIEEFGSGNLDFIIQTKSNDEFKWISNALNRMASQRKKVVSELSLQNEVIKNMAEGVYLVRQKDGIIVQANPKLEEMFGYDQGEMINKHVSMVNAPTDQDPEQTAEIIIRELSDRGYWSGEIHNIKKDGSTFWCSANVSVFDHPVHGAILISAHSDITKRKHLEVSLARHHANLEEEVKKRTSELQKEMMERIQVEKSLLESGERFRNLVDTMNSGVAIYNVTNEGETGSDYIIQSFNKYALKHEGLEESSVIGKSLKDLRPTIDDFGLINTFRAVWKTGDPAFFPAKVYMDKKFANYYENRVFRLPTGEIVAIYDDVTNEKLAETRLTESENLLREIIDNMGKGIAVYEPTENSEDFRFVEINEVAEKITHISKEAVVGKTIEDLFPGAASLGLIDKLKETYLTGKSTQIPLKQYQDNRITQWVENYIFKLPSGKVVAMFEDTFEKRQAEEQLKASLREKETLLHEIHHRVKNNMQVISSLLELQANTVDDSDIKAVLRESQSRVYTMAAVHETLHESDQLSDIDLQLYISRIIPAIFDSYLIPSNRITLKNEVESVPISIKQASPLGLIINELISNSLKYAFPNDQEGEIRIKLEQKNGNLELQIQDNGVGIPEDMDWRNLNSLGLKLVITLAEVQLDGTVNLDRTNGTKFSIRFRNDA